VPLDTQDGEEWVIDTDYAETISDMTGVTTASYLTVRDADRNEFDYQRISSNDTVGALGRVSALHRRPPLDR
jgi:hypothetical protein